MRAALVLVPSLAALPLLGPGHASGALGLLADYLGRHPWLHAAFALPEDVARDLGRLILVGQVLLQIAAGFACLRLLLRLGLDEAAPVGAVLYELAPAFSGTGFGGGIGVATTAPMVLAAVEHCLGPPRPTAGGGPTAGSGPSAGGGPSAGNGPNAGSGILALAGAVALLGGLGGHGGFLAVMSFALLWAALRLVSRRPVPAPRGPALSRLVAGACLGTLLAFPLLVRHAVLSMNWNRVDLDGLDDFFSGPAVAVDPGTALRALLALLPVLALGTLALGRGRSAPALRILLALVVIAAVAASGPWRLLPGIGPDAALPLLALSGVILAAATFSDLARGLAIGFAPRLAATGLIAAVGIAAARMHVADPRVVAGGVAAALLSVILAQPRGAWRRVLAVLVTCATAACFEVARLGA